MPGQNGEDDLTPKEFLRGEDGAPGLRGIKGEAGNDGNQGEPGDSSEGLSLLKGEKGLPGLRGDEGWIKYDHDTRSFYENVFSYLHIFRSAGVERTHWGTWR